MVYVSLPGVSVAEYSRDLITQSPWQFLYVDRVTYRYVDRVTYVDTGIPVQ